MPAFPITDSHVHFWNPDLIRYPWLDGNSHLNRKRLPADLSADHADIEIEAMVFIQCEADFALFRAEAEWAELLAEREEPRIKAIVAWAPLERGSAVADDLALLSQHPLLRGIRRIIQFEADMDFCLRDDFIAGVRALRDFDLSFDICVDHRHMANVLKLAERVPEVPMVLDHIGKPAIATGDLYPWAHQIRALAEFPNLRCKMSGVATEARHDAWTFEQLKPYMATAIEAFGLERVMFGGDWPVATQAIEYRRWVDLLDEMLSGCDPIDLDRFWRQNARAFYRID